jgi:hypothetical protein
MRTSSCKKTLNRHEDPRLHFSTMNKIQAACTQKREGNYPKLNASASRKLASFVTLATFQILSKAQKAYRHALKNVIGSVQNLRYTTNPKQTVNLKQTDSVAN